MMLPARTLLLIDDDDITREVLALLLSNEGWTVTAAAGGEEALGLLKAAAPPAVILCDLQMPGLCGGELAQAIRARAPSSMVLAMTATPQATPPDGYDALLVKPFPPGAVGRQYDTVPGRVYPPRETVQSNPEVQSVVLDPTVLEQLRRTMTADRLHALLIFVADDADTRIGRMQNAANTGNSEVFRAEAHALKGSCAMVGAVRLRELAARAEVQGLPDETLRRRITISEFVAETSAIRLMLEELSRGVM